MLNVILRVLLFIKPDLVNLSVLQNGMHLGLKIDPRNVSLLGICVQGSMLRTK